MGRSSLTRAIIVGSELAIPYPVFVQSIYFVWDSLIPAAHVIRYLLKLGADRDMKDKGDTALDDARSQRSKAVEGLLRAKRSGDR